MMNTYQKLHWTEHVKAKMKQYGLSKSKLMGLLRKPDRKESGIVPGTMAIMQTNKSYPSSKIPTQKKKAPGEIWLMYKDVKGFRRVISAWRYPGVSKPGETIPIPEAIRQEILDSGEL